MTHWLTRWDPEDGEPYGTLCDCEIRADHNGNDELMGPRLVTECSNPPAESCADAGCPVHGDPLDEQFSSFPDG